VANVAALRLLRGLDAERRPATAEEQQVLARWAGWGALPQLFDDQAPPEWAGLRGELAGLLSSAELAAARASTVNAHYTSAEVVQAVWALVGDLGFDGGRVLEPGCGSGNFIGFAPPAAELVGVEVEPVSARIAHALYPDADIRAEGFEHTRLAAGSFDLVIGNVPFGKYRLHDPVHNRGGHSIHNHFLVKAVDLVRPGGIVAVLTSRYTLDMQRPTARRELAGRADLLGAVRLPSGAFAAAAGTQAVTDLLLLRRRLDGEAALADRWERAVDVDVEGGRAEVNEWFAAHPDLVLGTLRLGSGLYGRELLVDAGDRPLAAELAAAGTAIADRARDTGRLLGPGPSAGRPAARRSPADSAGINAPQVQGREEGAFLLDAGGRVWRVAGGAATPAAVKPAGDLAELRALVGLRDAVVELLDLQAAGPVDDTRLRAAQQRLHRTYDAYTARYGLLNRYRTVTAGTDPSTGQPRVRRRYPTMGGFRADPHFHTVMALEVFDADTQTAHKAEVFDHRVITHRQQSTAAETPQDALAVCLDERGRVDLDRIGALLGLPGDQAAGALGDLVYANPDTGGWETAERYLSGNVRRKLASARQAAGSDPGWQRNVAALEAIQPRDLTPGEIDGRLGAAWVPRADVARFAVETLGTSWIRVDHAPITATWAVSCTPSDRTTVLMTSVWGTSRADAATVLEAALNQKPATVYDAVPGTDRRVVNAHETMLAREAQDKLNARFAAWLWEDPERAARLAADYNERFNSDVLTRYDGRHLTFPRLNAAWTMRPHQADAVWRIVSDPSALLAHVVGAGKTATMVAAGMEQRRLGLAAKPCYVVPNHMLEQFAREFLQLYPAARILVAGEDDASKDGRKAFVARCATGRWDAVILTHSAFGRLPVGSDTLAGYLEQRLGDYRAARDEQRNSGSRRTVKQLEAEIKRLEAKHQALLAGHRKDDGATFEQTGIDYLFIDEAHLFKNLGFATRIPGVGGQGSQRAEDLAMKLRWLRERHGRFATFATATPIANSVAEMYVMQAYLQPGALTQRGIGQFDAWAATFGTTVTALELAPDGGSYRMNTRFARFRNVPELVRMFAETADVQTAEMLALPIPAIAGGTAQTVVVAPSDELRGYVGELVARAEAIRNRVVQPDEDNMLKVTGDGRKAALDLRLVGRPPDPDGGKLAAVAGRTAALYHANADRTYRDHDGSASPRPGALQLVFCDLGTPRPGGGWSVYSAMRDQLVDRGVPADRIRFIHDAATDAAKAALFADCRDGRVAVLLGSTEKMGVGTNVQRRLVALHHLDAPWRPSDIAQREGRGLRQGNQNPEVHVVRYVTEASFDVYMWQTLERKAGFIGQVLTGRIEAREIEEVAETALSFAEVKALATGNPLVLEKAQVDADVARLSRLRSAHERDRIRMRSTEQEQLTRAAMLTTRADLLETTAAGRIDTRGDRFTIELDDQVHGDRSAGGDRLREQLAEGVRQAADAGREIDAPLGRLGGYPLRLQVRPSSDLLPTATVQIDAPAVLRVRYAPDELGSDPRYLVQRLERALQGVDADAASARRRAEAALAEAGRAQQAHATPFPEQERLAQLRGRQRQIEQQLAPEQPSHPICADPSPGTTSPEQAAPAAPTTPPTPQPLGPELGT
jgi:N12 class adenine-specific DNA methylase